ncbi:binding-protein-dependent transport systems inner membrane component [Xylanimonas cellulosilytica DSM 15894]|uniref:Binding-protein-dependent transport systems inner membrane component n=2 Tax=Xylanimonas TaxID=186188 RepID=D1BYR4_XYLCX|nr:ABC transporter permease [Xylanimonas cellulosilytica]ACZ29989.1 binding-protein-dependent transport systems inner membrane component [Xylanimonas cellulosilytica DSM 15894]
MLTFLARRILSSLLVLLGATFIVFMLFSYAVDPLEDLRFSPAPNAAQLIAERTALLNLDVPPVIRYFMWLGNVLTGDLGSSWQTGQSVTSMLGSAIPSTVTLVAGSIVLAIGLGILIGMVAALRQYTRFDYAVTFVSFVLFSLPSFWVAVLLKLWGAIGFNDFLADPSIAWYMIAIISVIGGALLSAIIGGARRTRWVSFAAATVATAAMLLFVSETDWLLDPSLGVVGIALLGGGLAFAVVALTAGLGNKRALYSALTAVAVGVALKFPLQFVFVNASWPLILGLAVAAAAVGCLIGWLFGGEDRAVSMRAAAITAVGTGAFLFVDRVMQVWYAYNRASQINHRPISTIGSQTPGLRGDFWIITLDQFTHILLPVITLVLISFAGYTRYTRASMLEVMNQDYIRTARAKGLSERVVTVRHAFRNALIPLATIVPLDVAAMFGGAIITETIFGWSGMGAMFITGLRRMDADVVMGHFLVVGSLLIVASILVDLVYAALDPRIRVNA